MKYQDKTRYNNTTFSFSFFRLLFYVECFAEFGAAVFL